MISSAKKAQIIWNCRRGMLELDLILNRFITNHLDHLTPNQILIFERLLNYSDPELYAWLLGHDCPVDKELANIVAFIQLYHNA